MGDTYSEMNDSAKTVDCYQRALELDPANSGALNNYAYFLAQRGQDITFGTQLFFVVESLQAIHIILEVIQVTLLLVVDHLLVTQGGLSLGVPVYHAQSRAQRSW